MVQVSPLAPIDPLTISSDDQDTSETEKKAPWIVRKLVGSLTGRVITSSLESLKAVGASVTCLSAWGDSSPLFLPCVRFRDLVVHAVIAGTGGVAAVAAPAMGPLADATVETFGDSLLVEIGLIGAFDVTVFTANEALIDHPIKHIIPAPSKSLETTGLKELTISIKFKHLTEDARLGFFRSSVHKDGGAEAGLFSDVKDYLAVEKGWFNPYLFASGRRPIIPRSMKPDVIFCHGPFLSGDYLLGTRLLNESASTIVFCESPLSTLPESSPAIDPSPTPSHPHLSKLHLPSLSKYMPGTRSRSPSPEPALAQQVIPPRPRRIAIMLLGIAPHRAGIWTSSARPGESTIKYTLLNGCPAVVVPARVGSPLVAWAGSTLEQIWELKDELPPPVDESKSEVDNAKKVQGGPRFLMAVDTLFEYVDLCTDWSRVIFGDSENVNGEQSDKSKEGDTTVDESEMKDAVRNALAMLLIAAICSRDSKEVKKEVDKDRAGIVFFRIP